MCRNVNAYSISGCEPKDTTAQETSSAAAMPEGLFTIEDHEGDKSHRQTEQQQGAPEDRVDISMSFLS